MLRRAVAETTKQNRFLLVLEHGEPCEPGEFVSPLSAWAEGETFVAGSETRRFRIVEIRPSPGGEFGRAFNAVWIVEPVV